MDINLPEMSGIDCAKRLKDIRPTLQIIMLTVYVENGKIFKSLMRAQLVTSLRTS
ncbi:MAG: response regulator [Limisphaerales bacterium]